jgi:hypothetical protein
MSGSAAPKSTKDQSTFDSKEDDNTIGGAVSKSSKSASKGQKNHGKKSKVRIRPVVWFGYNVSRLTALSSRPSVSLHEQLTLR